MVGGIVTETIAREGKVWVNVRDKRDECAIYVEDCPKSRSISEGDSLWWQGKNAYWTAKNSHGEMIGKEDVSIKRIGYSGVNRPT